MSKTNDPFAKVRAAASAHRARHGCGGYPYGDGTFLSVMTAAANAKRILELGTALGYSALSLAHGAPDAKVDTIEADPDHVRLAREQIAGAGYEKRITVHEGDFAKVLPTLKDGYDVVFFDGFTPNASILGKIRSLLRPRGMLICANLNHGGSANAVRDALADETAWLTSIVNDGETGVAIKL